MSQTSDNSSIIRPTLHHFGVATSHLERMVEWYSKVLGMVTIYSTSNALESEAGESPGLAFVSNDKANHRLAIISLPQLKDDADKKGHVKLQHVAFEYATIDDLLNSYTRIKELGIEPVLTTDHGVSTAFYYKDPDGNTIELFVDNFGNWDRSREYMQSSPDFGRYIGVSFSASVGTFVDAEKLVAARQAGMSFAELHRRAYAGEFPPSRPMDLNDLI
jgi:catechol 2,3-dioxygenase-like lactoylglutathione lyase family enzyme